MLIGTIGVPNFCAMLKTPLRNGPTCPSRVREPSAKAIKLIPESNAALARRVISSRPPRLGTSGTGTFPKRPIVLSRIDENREENQEGANDEKVKAAEDPENKRAQREPGLLHA